MVDTQIIANVVVRNDGGQILLVRYDPEDARWWLPGGDVEPYSHPDDAAGDLVGAIAGLETGPPKFDHLESFRGRRGWHLMFNYAASATDAPVSDATAEWFDADALPKTKHGNWEKQVIRTVLENSG